MKGTVIIISVVHWHFTWQSVHNIASGLASRGYRVLFVEPLPKRWPHVSELSRVWGRLTGRAEAAGLCDQPLVDGVEIVSPRLLPDVGSLAQAVNRQLFVPGIAAGLKEQVADGPVFVIDYLPTSASVALLRELDADANFYHCVFDWANDPYSQGELAERELAESVDMVWADSPVNFERTSAMQPNAITLAKGVDVELFAKARSPVHDMMPNHRPRCALFGTIGVHTDLDILRAVSHAFPLRLIGPVRVELTGFAPETEIVGAVAHKDVPGYLKDIDVLLLPYDKRSPHVAGIVPAKLFECLATGKPGVVAGLTSLGDLEPLFYMGADEQEFLQSIEEAASEDPDLRAVRIACAEENSYGRRFDEIEGYFTQVLMSKQNVENQEVPSSAHAQVKQTQ